MNKPFYLYMSHYAVHTPYDDDKRFSDKYRGKYDEQLKTGLNESEAKYAALVEGMDKSLGDILDYLQKNRRTRQTLWSAVQMLTQKLCCQTIHDCPKVVPLHYESE